MVDSDVGEVLRYPNAIFTTERHGTDLELLKIMDMTDQGHEESALFTRRNAVEASPMSDNTTSDSFVSDGQMNEQEDKTSHSNLETIGAQTIQIPDENTNMDNQMNEQQDDENSQSNLETIKGQTIQILDGNTNMDFEEESLKQRQMTDKQISIEITEEQLRDTDIQLREGLMKETGVVFTEKTSQQNDHGNHVTVSRESSMDFTEETSNQDSDSVPDQLDDTIEESMDEDKTQSVKTLKVRPLFLGEKIRLGKEMKMLGQLVNERRQKKKKKAHKEVDTGKQPEQEIKDDKDSFREETIYHRLITEPATQASLSSEMTSSVISKEIPSSNVTDDNRPADPDRKKPNTQNQDKKKPEKRKMKEEEADETVDNPKKKKKTGGKWSEHKREQAKLLKAAQLTKREERLRRERVRERLKELEERYHQVDNKDSEDTEQADEGTDKLPEDSSMVNKAAVHIPVLKRYILEENRETKEVLIEIDPVLLAKLKPHQVEAVRFMYDCCIESVDIVEFDQGGGCILAHCMGLGKTLSVISFVYTLMSKSELTTIKKSLIVCPLNTVKNWVNEFQKWTSDLNYKINVYELSNVKESKKRGELLKKWYNEGGVMILGYEMYRNLVQAGRGKVRVQKETYTEVLADPGPDLVICDEGHILKNSKSLQYKAMNRIRTRRRVILTGTPLQNNLKEYYHMVNYVKPLLLSTMKNFTKRFIDPITAGQCKDSSQSQIDDMRRRVHVLHKILGGCVQRKDYSALTKFLPPKHEYVISVRMGTKQCALYQKYLCKTEKYLYMTGFNGVKKISGRDARLFRDYQILMRIWTHPWLLTRKREKKESKVSKSQTPTYIREPTVDQSPVTIKNTESVDCFVNKSAKLCMDVQSVNTESGLDVQNVKIKPGLDLQNMETDSSMDKENIEPGSDVQDVKRESKMNVQYDAEENNKDIRRVDSDSPPHLDPVGEVSTLEENLDREVPRDERNDSPFDSRLPRSEQIFPVIKPEYEEISNSSWPVKPDEASNISDEEHSPSTFMEYPSQESPDIPEVLDDWWREHVTDDDGMNMSMSGKIMLLFEILNMCRQCKDKLLVFSQSIPSLNLIEGFLGQQTKSSSTDTGKNKVKKTWIRDKDYFRIDGTTSAQKRKEVQKSFNDPENDRACLFLISTKAGSLGTNLVAANRVIIFDASWNPSHDVQSIFRVYRFGQVKPVYVYRFLAQGTMEEKIYERQVTKQSLSQRVIDEQQIERHFTAADLQALYEFKPDRLDDPNREHRPLPNLPKDELLANLMTSQKQWIVTFHEHDSLLENIEEEELTEEEKEAAWSEYERKALHIVKPVSPVPFTGMNLDDQAQSSPGHQFLTNSDSEDLPNIGSVDLDAWFEKPANTELLSALGDMIKEKYPDILMQDDLNPEIPRQDLPQDSLDSQNSFGHLPYQPDQRDINDQQVETFAAGKNDLMVNYDNMVQGPSTSRYGSSFAAGIRPHQDYSYNLGRHDATSVTDSVKEAPQPSSGVTANENISKNSVNTSEQLLSVGNPLDVAKTFPDTEPLDLSFVEDLSPINMYKETRAERDLNTPELIITDEQRSESNSDTRGWIGDTYHIPKSYYSSSVGMSYKKPKQRMLQRLLLETMDTSTPTFTFSDEQSFGTVSPPQSMQETTPLNLSSRDTAPPIQQTVPLNLSVRDTPMQAPLIPAILTLTDSLSVDSTDYTLNDVESTSTSSVGLDTDTLNNSSETHTLTGDGNQETRSTDKVSTDSRFSSVIQLDSNTLFNSSETSTLKGDGSQEILITTHPVSSDSNTSSIIKLDTDTLSNSSETNIKGSGKREILKTDQVFSDSGSYSLTHLDTDTHSNSSAFQDDDNEKLNITDQVSSDSTSSSSSVTELDTDTHSNSSETGVVNSDIIQDIHETDQTTRNSTSSPVIQLETDTPLYLSHKSLPKGDEDAETAVSPTSADVPDSIKEVNSAADEQFDDLQELNIPSVVLENTVLRQESVTTDTHMKSSSFSPIKTDEYEDISDSEEDL